MKVIVIGAGVLGASAARHLAVAGADVLLLDRLGAGTGTSATTFAWTNSSRKPHPAYHRLNLAGMEEHARLAAELPGAPSYFPSGALQWADAANERRLSDHVTRLRSLGYPAHWVTADEAGRIAGGLRVPATITSLAHFPSEGYVLPDRFVEGLVADAERHGAAYAAGEVEAVDDGPDGVAVTLTGGRVHRGDRVVLAAGRWTRELAARAGIDVPMVTDTGRGAQTVGLLGYVRQPRLDLRCVIHSPGLNLRPAGGGHTVLQALDLNAAVDPRDPPSADGDLASTLVRRFRSVLPDPAGTPRIELRVGLRSLPADGHTVAGYADARARVYCLVSHSGVTLAPVLGRLAAAEITTDREQELLAAFRPTRFTGAARPDTAVDQRAVGLGEQ
ncbi:NAD(P)/FAD-dependent oxidoreductase [Streptomyces scabiei]|uniref:NAD(P)/FAD-dependent oxidoreductase n=1 Tax=Streptomyces scabiei TaxID=1930 RepID=UPI001B32D1BF|nr:MULTISPECIES: FAD-dependent oxidoreductase [Streptomyces]MBP5889213.1 FAD-binding oxidoreductase [Streptomyces sp. LBUM 1481]MBP5919235.1 FAD-binding oxidoreductase [Streptomyces sp. LBUM 1483]MDX2688657.1 FAD-dependent oxidoreductase [Streptomyces scabiei]MDX2752455.1 FAD-dependent oxidoreductase [Streptomyces scabiei]MDX2806581.1 FAD-dependent oxidoreductase [Streptomyces scabiei]